MRQTKYFEKSARLKNVSGKDWETRWIGYVSKKSPILDFGTDDIYMGQTDCQK